MITEVLYRKWRPQTLADVVGQEHVTQTLLNALAQERVAHAYLFCGPRGTGKTSTARILAKAVNCLKNGRGEPCNDCHICQAVTGGSALDLIEIDAASNRGIDEVRDLRERANYSPSEARFKIYIIDEVHMMTTPAFNALLKTLEEPPPHIIFILATTEAHKLPLTIVSRCQRFDFRRISQEATLGRLETICQAEGVEPDPWVLRFISRASGGSLRDAENLLEQLMVSYGNRIEPRHVRELLGISAEMPLEVFIASMLRGDVAESLRILHGVVEQGANLRYFQRELLEYLRSLMMVVAGAEDVVDIPAEEMTSLKGLAPEIGLEDVTRALHIFSGVDLKADGAGPFALETALVEVCLGLGKKIVRPEASARFSDSSKESLEKPPAPVKEPPPPIQQTTDLPPETVATPRPEAREPDEPAGPEPSPPDDEERPGPEPVPINDIDVFRRRWPELVDALKGQGSKGSLDALLRNACEPIAIEGETLVVGFYYPFHKSKIEDPKYRHLVEKKVSEVFGAPYKIRCDLVTRESPPPAARTPDQGPLVQAALEMGARVLDDGLEKAN